jgi:hypothetical protein
VKPRREALERIAQRVVDKALDGDRDAIVEIGNRLDGKPRQEIAADFDATFHIHWPLPPSALEDALSREGDESMPD